MAFFAGVAIVDAGFSPQTKGDHISTASPWGIRKLFQVVRLDRTGNFSKRERLGTYFDEAVADSHARANKATTVTLWAVRVGSRWYGLSSVYSLSPSTETFPGQPLTPHPDEEKSIYPVVLPGSRWTRVMDPGSMFEVMHVAKGKYSSNSASQQQVVYVDHHLRGEILCHPMSQWHVNFQECTEAE